MRPGQEARRLAWRPLNKVPASLRELHLPARSFERPGEVPGTPGLHRLGQGGVRALLRCVGKLLSFSQAEVQVRSDLLDNGNLVPTAVQQPQCDLVGSQDPLLLPPTNTIAISEPGWKAKANRDGEPIGAFKRAWRPTITCIAWRRSC